MELPPHDVPAKGVLEWELIAFPAPFKGDTWLTAMEILPGRHQWASHCFSFEKHKPRTSTTVTNGCTYRATVRASDARQTADLASCRI